MYLRCPYCGSTHLEYEKVFNYKYAFFGALFFHIWGALFGYTGRSTEYTCCKCGFTFQV